MPETPPLLEDGTHGEKPKLLTDGRMPLRKKVLIGAFAVVIVVLIVVGTYISLRKPASSSKDNTTSSVSNASTQNDLDVLPDSTAIGLIDDSSLAQDLTTINTGIIMGDENDTATDTALNDKTKEVSVQTTATGTEKSSDRLARIKARGDEEIARRLDALNRAITAVNGATALSADARDTLSTELGNEVTGLASLRIKLEAETTAPAAANDITTMVTEYRVYALLVPKARLVRAADNQIAVEQRLGDIHTKLEKRISQAETKGKNVATLKSQLSELESHVTAAKDLSNSIETGLLPLQPTDYNTDHSILGGYRDKLKTAHTHNKTAANLAKQIVKGLKSAE
jgi:hypothetical protein